MALSSAVWVNWIPVFITVNGNILDGNVALTILNTVKADSGSCCCRVDIAGCFNDGKVSLTLKAIKAPALTTTLPNPLSPTAGAENHNRSEPHPPHKQLEWRKVILFVSNTKVE
ncbi:hepatitis A virus cellular receptor 1 homolog [Polyodon spathula]|uniref:hepatitis A virus cellular receptor 1 homolog n=1 Tax=Polyodon spathula TaxID=7913 RepID=UPI001B7EE463|nr:hepatitis A virus cellular receptor 1 homolog [Polyodon spathula]